MAQLIESLPSMKKTVSSTTYKIKVTWQNMPVISALWERKARELGVLS